MADLATLENALRKAHATGDEYAAKRFADEIRAMRNGVIAPTESPNQPSAYNPTEGMSGPDLRMAGIGKAVHDIGLGGGQLARKGLESSGAKNLADYFGLPTQSDVDEYARLDTPLMESGSGLAGNIAGNVISSLGPGGAIKYAGQAAKIPRMVEAGRALINPSTIRQGVTLGTLLGLTQPVKTGDSQFENVGISAAAGGAGAMIPNAISRIVQPQTRESVKKLIDEGVTPTLGQILGGWAHRIEDGATSLPFVGDAIKSAQRRGVEDFNNAAYNRALKPIGESMPDNIPAGHKGIEYAHEQISNAYEDLLPKLKVRQDQQFNSEIASLSSLTNSMPAKQAEQFQKMLDADVLSRFGQGGGMLGETMKEVDSKLGLNIRRYSKSPDPDHQQLADALKETQSILRGLVERSNPQYAPELKAINTGFANLLRPEVAAARTGANDGLFSAAQLKSAVRELDSSVRKRRFAHGNALMQDLAEAGQDVLGQTVPDSGTPFRLNNMLPLGAAYMASPSLAVGALGAVGAYSEPGVTLAKLLLTQRPQGAAAVSKAIAKTAPTLSRLGIASANSRP